MKKLRLRKTYTTLEGEKLDLSKLTEKEKSTARKFQEMYISGISYLDFTGKMSAWTCQWITDKSRMLHSEVGPPEQKVIYKYIDDLAKRLGIKQGYLVKCEVVKNCGHKHRRQEVEIDYITKRLNCTRQFVLNDIYTAKLRARNDHGKHLIRIKDANAFIRYHKSKRKK